MDLAFFLLLFLAFFRVDRQEYRDEMSAPPPCFLLEVRVSHRPGIGALNSSLSSPPSEVMIKAGWVRTAQMLMLLSSEHLNPECRLAVIDHTGAAICQFCWFSVLVGSESNAEAAYWWTFIPALMQHPSVCVSSL